MTLTLIINTNMNTTTVSVLDSAGASVGGCSNIHFDELS